MGLITDLTPLNADTEKEKFLSQEDYNPQFEYVRDFSREEMTKYGTPNEVYFTHAKKMLARHDIPKRSKPINKQPANTPPPSTQAETKRVIESLLDKLQLSQLPIRFSKKNSSQVMISTDGIFFRLPIKFNLESLKNKLNHEIQTHFLRRYNQKLQSWDLKSARRNPRAFLTTEEGLANLHSYLARPDNIMRKTYLNYYSAFRAMEVSFRELYNELLELGVKKSLAWNLTLKQKRGLKDTSKPGGWPKNHVYFEGTVKVWHWLQDRSNDPHQLYWGRIALQDIPKVQILPISDQVVYPTFYADLNSYYQFITAIGEENELDALPVIP